MSVVDFGLERAKREAPDPEFVRHDDYGRVIRCFTCSYGMGGRQWCTQVWAYDFDDAEARVAGMRESLRVDGQLFAEGIA